MTIKINRAAVTLVLLVTLLACATTAPDNAAQRAVISNSSAADAARGQLLYHTACAGCHTERLHWREKHLVLDWSGLIKQVTQWQRTAGQNWRADEIDDVAAYLNDRFYHLPCPVRVCAAPRMGAAGLSFTHTP